MRLAVLWLLPACCHEIRPPVWHLIPIHPGQILATQAFQTTRISSAMCPSIIFSLTLYFLGQPMDMLLKPSRSLNGGPPALQFYGWKPKSMLPIFPGPCNIAAPFLHLFFFFFLIANRKCFYFPYLKDITISCCVWNARNHNMHDVCLNKCNIIFNNKTRINQIDLPCIKLNKPSLFWFLYRNMFCCTSWWNMIIEPAKKNKTIKQICLLYWFLAVLYTKLMFYKWILHKGTTL